MMQLEVDAMNLEHYYLRYEQLTSVQINNLAALLQYKKWASFADIRGRE